MHDFVIGCSVAYIQRTALLDPNYTEASAGGPELTVAVQPKSGKVSLATMDSRLPLEQLQPVLELAQAGALQLYDIMRTVVLEHTSARLDSRGVV